MVHAPLAGMVKKPSVVTATGFPDEPVSMNYGGSMNLSFLRMLVGEICANRGEFGLNLTARQRAALLLP